MNKLLLVMGAAALGVGSLCAAEPQVQAALWLNSISPNGKWAASQYMYSVHIVNLETGKIYDYVPEGAGQFGLGMGNCISNDGIVLGARYDGDISYWQNGEWKDIPTNDAISVYPGGITPDGKRICGYYNPGTQIDKDREDNIMQIPVIWNQKEDGTYSEPIGLPYPEKDWTGRLPQYITLNYISADGNTIVGNVQDYAGFTATPIVYTVNDKGEWSYTMPLDKYYNPNHIEMTPFPESPKQPQLTDFMTEEERAYYEDICASYEGDWESGPLNPENYGDFMTAEELAKYNEAFEKYKEELAAFDEEWNKANTDLWDAISQSTYIDFNSVLLNHAGTVLAATKSVEDPEHTDMWGRPLSIAIPLVIDVKTGELTKLDKLSGLIPNQVLDNGILVLSYGIYDLANCGQLLLPGQEETVSAYDYIAAKDAELGKWMKENMTHEFEEIAVDEEGNFQFDDEGMPIYVKREAMATGLFTFDEEMQVALSCVQNGWSTEESDPYVYSYIMKGDLAGIKDVSTDGAGFGVRAMRGGIIAVQGNANVAVYDMSGRCVFNGRAANATINTGLASGIYTVRATDGKAVKTYKVAL